MRRQKAAIREQRRPVVPSGLLSLSRSNYSAAGASPLAFFLAGGLGFAFDLVLPTLGGAGAISNDGALSLIRTLTSPPLTSLPNSSSSASGCLIFSCSSRPIGRAP